MPRENDDAWPRAQFSILILRAARKRGVSKDEGPIAASWFETRTQPSVRRLRLLWRSSP
jgi:hypothetical protein